VDEKREEEIGRVETRGGADAPDNPDSRVDLADALRRATITRTRFNTSTKHWPPAPGTR
jgi:hypothetical protein